MGTSTTSGQPWSKLRVKLSLEYLTPSLLQQVLCCHATDLRPLAILLSAVHFSPRANIQISAAGLHIQVEIGKTLQAHAYLEKEAFTEWSFNPPMKDTQTGPGKLDPDEEEDQEDENLEECKFEISMSGLIECLNVFGTASSSKSFTKNIKRSDENENGSDGENDLNPQRKMWENRSKTKKLPTSAIRITYDGEGHPLVLLIEDSGVVTRCALVTYEPEELAELDFPVERQVVHLIMKSDWLKSAFGQFDEKSATEISLTFSPPKNKDERDEDRPTFRIEVEGQSGSWTIDFPNDRDILESFMCKLPEGLDPGDIDRIGFVRNSYKLSHMLKAQKALDVSSKASLRIDDTGFLSLQLLIPLEESYNLRPKKGYVEFLCVPIEDG